MGFSSDWMVSFNQLHDYVNEFQIDRIKTGREGGRVKLGQYNFPLCRLATLKMGQNWNSVLNDGQGRGSELMKQGAQLSSFF